MNRNEKELNSFVEYMQVNPNLRFWQGLRNWSGYNFILKADKISFKFDGTHKFTGIKDTFYK